ncbi:MAG: hypothetical protein GDA38_15520 [Hormoscilla sp. SP12CHS1]|nr:hypothetical protein [Hormoscilla sp. SP12CHS1]
MANVLETQRLSLAGRALGRGTLPLTLVPRVSLGMGSHEAAASYDWSDLHHMNEFAHLTLARRQSLNQA